MLNSLAEHKLKIIGALAFAGVLIVAGISIDRIAYNRGLNVSAVEIASYESRVQNLNAQLRDATGKVTERIVTEYLTDVVERERIVYRNRDVIVTQVPEQYTLSQGWIDAHDQSALGNPIDPEIAANAFPSAYTDAVALQTINDNYAICQANLSQLTALQNWTREIREVTDEVVDNQ